MLERVTSREEGEQKSFVLEDRMAVLEQQLRLNGIPHYWLDYKVETVACGEKRALWDGGAVAHVNLPAEQLAILKSLLLSFRQDDGLHYIMVCSTEEDGKIDFDEVRQELGLRGASLQFASPGIFSEGYLPTGQRAGEVGPLLSPEGLAVVDSVYFTAAVLRDAEAHANRLYDVPLTRDRSLLVNARDLFLVLVCQSNRYRTARALEGGIVENRSLSFIPRDRVPETQEPRQLPLPLTDDVVVTHWNVHLSEEQARCYVFAGTDVLCSGQRYRLRNPGATSCIALPFTVGEHGERKYEHIGTRTRRVTLALGYDRLAELYEKNLKTV